MTRKASALAFKLLLPNHDRSRGPHISARTPPKTPTTETIVQIATSTPGAAD
jgi:hypothetical protein